MANQLIGLRVVILGAAEARREMRDTEGAINSVGSAIQRIAGVSAQFGQSITRVGNSIADIGRAMTFGITVPLLALNGALINAGIQFEDAFAGISKTVEGVAVIGEDGMVRLTEAGNELRESIRDLALEIPVTANELAEIGQIAGQLGVRGKEDLLTFIETVAKMGVATDLSSQEAAFGLARLQNILGSVGRETETMSEFVTRTSATIVALGNNAAATESEILNLSLRLASAGRIAGLTTPEVLGLAASLAEIGVRAELGGTALSRVLQEVVFAIADGGDALNTFAEIAGKTAEQFATDFKNDPVAALEQFIGALARAQEEGLPGLKDKLAEMGFEGVRVRDVINRLGGDLSVMRDNIDLATQAWEDQIALEEEAAKRYATVSSQIQLLKNSFTDLGIAIFDLVKDDMIAFIQSIRDLLGRIRDLDPRVLKFILTLLSIAAAVGPILVVFGTFIAVLGTLVTAFTALFSIGGLLTVGFLGLGAVAAGVAASMIDPAKIAEFLSEKLDDLFQILTDLATGETTLEDLAPPSVLVVLNAYKALVADIVSLLSGDKTLADIVPAFLVGPATFIDNMVKSLKEVLAGDRTFLSIFPPVVQDIARAVGAAIQTVFDLLNGDKTLADVLPPEVMVVIGLIKNAFDTLRDLITGDKTLEDILPESVLNVIAGVESMFATLGRVLSGDQSLATVFPPELKDLAEDLDVIIDTIADLFRGDVTLPEVLLKGLPPGTLEGFANLGLALGSIITLANKLGSSEGLGFLQSRLLPAINELSQIIQPLMEGIRNNVGEVFEFLSARVNDVLAIFEDPIFENMDAAWKDLGLAVDALVKTFAELSGEYTERVGPESTNIAKIIGTVLVFALGAAVVAITSVIRVMAALIRGAAEMGTEVVKIVRGVMDIFEGFQSIVIGVVDAVVGALLYLVGKLTGNVELMKAGIAGFQLSLENFRNALVQITSGWLQVFTSWKDAIGVLLSNTIHLIGTYFDLMFENTIGVFLRLVERITGSDGILEGFKREATDIFNTLKNGSFGILSGFVTNVITKFTSMKNSAVDIFNVIADSVNIVISALDDLLTWVTDNTGKILELWEGIQDVAEDVHDELFGSPRFKIQYGLEDLHKFIKSHDFDIGVTMPTDLAAITNAAQPVLPFDAGRSSSVDHSINVDQINTGPVRDGADLTEKMVSRMRLARARGSW
jgi:TP901 family phage tail tape measure protein